MENHGKIMEFDSGKSLGTLNMTFKQNIQIKIAMSKDNLRILIKILAKSCMAFDCGDKIALPNLYPII